MRLRRHAALALVTMLLVAAPAHSASPGGLDRSFGDDGWVSTRIVAHEYADAVAIDSHKRIVAAGAAADAAPDQTATG